MIEKIDGHKINPDNSFTSKVGEQFHQVFQYLQYHYLKPYKTSMMHTKIKIARKQLKSYQNAKMFYICKERTKNKHGKHQN